MESIARTGTLYEVGLYSIGEALLKDTFRELHHALLHNVTDLSVQETLAFVQGSGLEVTIDTFGLALDAEKLRETFFQWTSHSLVLSSATILAGSLNGVSSV